MRSRSATELPLLPVQLHRIRLGRPVDVLLDPVDWRALGFVVLCGDDVERFLVFAGGDLREDRIAVPSAFLLLEDVDFYRARSLVVDEGDALREVEPTAAEVESVHVSTA